MDAKFLKAVSTCNISFVEEHLYDVSRATLEKAITKIDNIIRTEFSDDDEEGVSEYMKMKSSIEFALS